MASDATRTARGTLYTRRPANCVSNTPAQPCTRVRTPLLARRNAHHAVPHRTTTRPADPESRSLHAHPHDDVRRILH
eukprot:2249236-Rhodomonas_salina.3